MSNVNYNYDVADVELYKTNLYGGSDADLDNTAPVDDTDGYTADIDLTSKIFAAIDCKFDGNNATDDLVLTLYRRRDASWDGDEISIWSVTISNDGSEDIYALELGPHKGFGPGHYRFAMQSSGASTTFDIDVQMRQTDYVQA
jgi:hypothetical protein